MNREYDLFERLPDGSLKWRGFARGTETARLRLRQFATETMNECLAMHIPTQDIVARVNTPSGKGKRIFQIAYTDTLLVKREDELWRRGYEVVSVIGNEAAKKALSSLPHYDLFIVGHAAPQETRKELLEWLRKHYSKARILALDPPQNRLPGVDYNAIQNGSDAWLPLIGSALG